MIRTLLLILLVAALGAGVWFAGDYLSLALEPVVTGEELERKMDAEDFPGAIRSVRRLLLGHKGDPVLLETLATLYEQNDEPEKAEKIYRGLLEKNGSDPVLHFYLARTLHRANRIPESLAQLDQVHVIAKALPATETREIEILAWALTGEIHTQITGNYRKAIPAYQRLLKLDPSRADMRYQLGMAYAYAGLYQTAYGEFSQVVRENPNTEIAKYAENAIQYVRERRHPGKSNVLMNYGE